MAKKLTRRQLEKLAESFEPAIRKAFLDAANDIRNQASVRIVAQMIEAGRVDALAEVLGVNAARFAPLVEAVRTAYLRSALLAAGEIPTLRSSVSLGGPWAAPKGYQVAWSFDITNPQAESWLREHSSKLVTSIVEDQRNNIRAVVAEGMAIGRGPRQTALDVVGRVGVTGRRSGGIIGLTSQQAQFVANARAELSDPARMANYFSRQRRDKRFDATVRKAMKGGKALTPDQIDKITGRYSDKLLQLRGEVVSRTESLTAMNAAREESYRQAIEAGDLLPENVICTWGAEGGPRTRDTHAALHGQERPFGEPFQSPSGAMMMFPGDTSLNAGPEETIQCRCTKVYRVKHAAEELRGQ